MYLTSIPVNDQKKRKEKRRCCCLNDPAAASEKTASADRKFVTRQEFPSSPHPTTVTIFYNIYHYACTRIRIIYIYMVDLNVSAYIFLNLNKISKNAGRRIRTVRGEGEDHPQRSGSDGRSSSATQ